MSLEKFIEGLETKVKQIEAGIQQSINNHNGLLGMLQGAKEALVAGQIAAGILPDPNIQEGLKAAEEIVNVAENVTEALAPAAAPEVVQPAVSE